MQKAKWIQQTDNSIICKCCPHECHISEGKTGICGTYINQGHTLLNQRYYRFSSICLDPIEKKPLYHFYPSSQILSLGGYGCNMSCFYCQNHSISQNSSLGTHIPRKDIIQKAKDQNAVGIALTYNEPLTNYETAYDLFQECKHNNLKTVLVTNGYIHSKPLKELVQYVDAINLDIKFPTNELYKKNTGAFLDPVLHTCKEVSHSCHLEVTYLVIPGVNDSTKSVQQFISFISSVNPEIPVHFNAYYPQFNSSIPATPPNRIQEICILAQQSLSFVYGGNIYSNDLSFLNNTYCPKCHSLLIERYQFHARIHNMRNSQCTICGNSISNIKGSLI